MSHDTPMGVANGVATAIKELRQARKMSQADLADAVCRAAGRDTVTRNTISRWESGKRSPSPYWRTHLATALNVPITVLEAARVDRRRFLMTATGAMAAPLVVSDLLAAGFEAAEHRRTADDWEAVVDYYGRAYMRQGAPGIRDRLEVDMLGIQQHLTSSWAYSTAAVLAVLYAKTLPFADHAVAVDWYRRSATLADRSGDDHTRVWVRGRAAVALAYEGSDNAVADRLAQEALAISTRPSTGRLTALLGSAHVAALRGDAADAHRLREDANRVFDRIGSDGTVTDYSVPYWRHSIWASGAAARTGDARAAISAQAAAREAIPQGYDRFRTHLDMHHALMLVKSGDRRGGVEHATAALNALSAPQRSATLRRLAAEVRSVQA